MIHFERVIIIKRVGIEIFNLSLFQRLTVSLRENEATAKLHIGVKARRKSDEREDFSNR